MANALKHLSLEHDGGVAVVSIDCAGEPVNTLSPELARDLEELLTSVAADPRAVAVVVISAKPDGFVAGAKIDLLAALHTAAEATALSRQAQSSFDRLDAFAKPVVAAIHGACLGGGLELALACDYRIATDGPKTVLGLPETQLGLIPGAGGTQRLPRLIGAQAALELILGAKNVKPKKALRLGLVDEVVPPAILREFALRRARELADGTLVPDRQRGLADAVRRPSNLRAFVEQLVKPDTWTGLALEDNPLGRRLLFDKARKALLKKTRGKYPAPERALEAIRAGLEKGAQAGFELEAAAFGELCVSDVSKRLVELFFATTALKKESGAGDPSARARPVERVGVLGGGLMGSGIAYVATALQGARVRLRERDDVAAARALASVRELYDERVRRKSISWRERDQAFAHLSATTDWTGFKHVQLVIEAVFEELALKQELVRAMEGVCGPDAIFASNTSAIPIARIAQGSQRPERIVGMHYFSPVHRMPLLEIVRHPGSADWAVATCVEVGRRQGKTVIVVNDGVGFFTTRVLGAFLNEAVHLLSEGADVAELDRALVDFGFPVGPAALLDDVGIDVGAKVGATLHEAFGERMAAPPVAEGLLGAGRLGRKARSGFYRYEGSKRRGVDEAVYELLPLGKERRRIDRQELAERCVLRFVNEAVRCLGEGVLRCARDGDVGAVFGIGFPPFLGGPFRYAEALGIGRLLEKTEHYQERLGRRFEPAPLLTELLRDARRFYG